MKCTSKIFQISVFFFSALLLGCQDSKEDSNKKIEELKAEVAKLESEKILGDSQQVDQKPDGPLPMFEFEEDVYDFGDVIEGEEVEYEFKFKNTGQAPLAITEARPSCGCTVPEWSKDAIAPGEVGSVRVRFNTTNKPGIQNKTVTLLANTWPSTKVLSFKANVISK